MPATLHLEHGQGRGAAAAPSSDSERWRTQQEAQHDLQREPQQLGMQQRTQHLGRCNVGSETDASISKVTNERDSRQAGGGTSACEQQNHWEGSSSSGSSSSSKVAGMAVFVKKKGLYSSKWEGHNYICLVCICPL